MRGVPNWVLPASIALLLLSPEVLVREYNGLAAQDLRSCRTEVKKKATLGRLEDPSSVEIPLDVFVAEVPWGGWVVTEDGRDVIQYAPNGDFRSTLGRRGEGPGELRHPNAVAVDPTDSTWVSDHRGRAVIFGADGLPARTIVSSSLFQIDGFSDSGLPFSMLVRRQGYGARPSFMKFIQIWSREEGEPLSQIGPGALPQDAQEGSVLDVSPAFPSIVLGDSVGVVPVSWEGWLTFWAESREWRTAPADSVWMVLGLDDPPESHFGGEPVAVTSDGLGGFWVLGVVRRMSQRQEDELVQRVAPPRGEADPYFIRQSAPVSNAAYDGAILHVDADGTITSGTTFEEYPRGFAGPSQFFSFTEEENGLIKIHIWEFGQDCS